MQPAKAGDSDEYESVSEAGRAAERRPATRDDGRPLRDQVATSGVDQERGELPIGGLGGMIKLPKFRHQLLV